MNSLATVRNKQRAIVIGEKYGKLTVMRRHPVSDARGNTLWECVCDCGNKRTAITGKLNNGNARSCGSKQCRVKMIRYRNPQRLAVRENNNIYLARKHLDLSVNEFARLMGVWPHTVIEHETGLKKRMGYKVLRRFNKVVPKEFRINKYYETYDKQGALLTTHSVCKQCGTLFPHPECHPQLCCNQSCGAKYRQRMRFAGQKRFFLCSCGRGFSRTPSRIRCKGVFCERSCYHTQCRTMGRKNVLSAKEISKQEYEMRQSGIDEEIIRKPFETRDQAIERTIAAYNKKGREGIKPTQAIKDIVKTNTGKREVVD